ncbi:MAG: DNA polymerase I [Muribaculaceae bacterium]|nr:DNA polymerase I [Muribaculaceae bacterium]
MEKKLFLLDAYALIYRAYYALIRQPRITSKGFNTSAVFGFCNTLEDILRKENPTHIAVCFDPKGGHTFRHEIYPEYKAQRDAQPEDITLSVPYIKDIIAAYRIPVVEMERYEADDIIGTLAKKAEREGFTTYMMTPDKDYGQLVSDRIFMYRPALRGNDFEVRGVKEVCARYDIDSPMQVIDLLALEGDASDNIPGCPGVGKKTAPMLIKEYGSVENLIANAESLKPGLKKKVTENAAGILLAKELVTIKTDVPLDIDLDTFRRTDADKSRLREIYKELEFKTFLARIEPDAPEPAKVDAAPGGMGSLFDLPEAKPQELAVDERIETGAEALREYVASVNPAGYVGVSVCATGEDAMTASLKGVAVALSESDARFFAFPDAAEERTAWTEALRTLFAGSAVIVSHDVKRDMIVLANNGVDFSAPYYDTSVAHYLLQPDMRHRLSDIALSYLDLMMRGALDESARRNPYAELPLPEAAMRGAEAARVVLMLRGVFDGKLSEGGLTTLFTDIELPFIKVLAEMEMTGVRINVDELAKLSVQLTARVNEMEQRCYALAGKSFNIGSPRQVGEILFEHLKIDPKAKRTKTGAYSTTEEILEKHRHTHEVVDLILKIRGLNKLLATYINALPELINPATGKIHTSFNQTVTVTGRISSTNPNLQNIPIRTDDGREIRRAFIPDEGCLLMSADYSQIELRLMAEMSGDPDMVAAFREGVDIHRATAAKIYKMPLEEVSDRERRNAKTANFGIIYGISAFGLSERLDIPRAEAKMLIDGYFETYPRVKEYIDESVESARTRGYVTTVMGRKRYLPDINSRNATVRSYAERNAVNAPLQGSAADIIKKAMIEISREMKARGMRSRMIIQVHDELVFNVVPDELPALQQLVTRLMEGAYSGKVALEVASGVGANWLEAH